MSDHAFRVAFEHERVELKCGTAKVATDQSGKCFIWSTYKHASIKVQRLEEVVLDIEASLNIISWERWTLNHPNFIEGKKFQKERKFQRA